MKLRIDDSFVMLVNACDIKLRGNKPPEAVKTTDWAIPGGGVATTEQVLDWAMLNEVEMLS